MQVPLKSPCHCRSKGLNTNPATSGITFSSLYQLSGTSLGIVRYLFCSICWRQPYPLAQGGTNQNR